MDCCLAGCNAVHLCEECVPSVNHKCGRVAILQMAADIKEQNAIDTKKELEEQAAVFEASPPGAGAEAGAGPAAPAGAEAPPILPPPPDPPPGLPPEAFTSP